MPSALGKAPSPKRDPQASVFGTTRRRGGGASLRWTGGRILIVPSLMGIGAEACCWMDAAGSDILIANSSPRVPRAGGGDLFPPPSVNSKNATGWGMGAGRGKVNRHQDGGKSHGMGGGGAWARGGGWKPTDPPGDQVTPQGTVNAVSGFRPAGSKSVGNEGKK